MVVRLALLGAKFPNPPDQVPPVATVTEPDKVASALLAHKVCVTPALAVGAAV